MEHWEIDEVAKVLAALVAENKNYSYIDKLGYAPSKDLALFYLKEALRDLHSMLSREFENKKAEEVAKAINFSIVEKALKSISEINERKALREATSMIAAKALAKSASLTKSTGGGS
ncbi:MAG: type I-A CRISPR-associated protein Csa5 [Candidatus Bathyarchaeia archaeon]